MDRDKALEVVLTFNPYIPCDNDAGHSMETYDVCYKCMGHKIVVNPIYLEACHAAGVDPPKKPYMSHAVLELHLEGDTDGPDEGPSY